MSDERFEQDVRDAVRSLAPSAAPDSLRQRAAAIPTSAPARSLFAPWGISAGLAVAGVAVMAVLVLALAPKPVGPNPSGSPNPKGSPSLSARFGSATGDFLPYSIAFWSDGFGLVGGRSGAAGEIQRTTDGGKSWTLAYLANGPVTQVTVAGRSDGWAIVDCRSPVFETCMSPLHTTDGGLTWQGLGSDMIQLAFKDDRHGWGIGGGSEGVVQTDVGGSNWSGITQPCPDTWPRPAALTFDPDGNLWVVCTDNSTDPGTVGKAVFISADGGGSWERRAGYSPQSASAVLTIPPQGRPSGIVVNAAGAAVLWGTGMHPQLSTDGGRHWSDLSTPAMENDDLLSEAALDSVTDAGLFWDASRRTTVLGTSAGKEWVERFRWVLAAGVTVPVSSASPAPTPAPNLPRSGTYLTWSDLPMPGTGAIARGVTTFGAGFIAVGYSAGPCCGGEPAFDPNQQARVWRYTDGAGWALLPNQTAFALGEMRGVTASARLLVAYGFRDLQSAQEPATWTSRDGRTWQLHRQVELFTKVTSSPFGFIGSVSTPSGPEIWSSTDGIAWHRIANASAMGPGTINALRYTTVGLVAVGYAPTDAPDPRAGSRAISWLSANGLTWQRSPNQESLRIGIMEDVAVSGSILEAAGWAGLDSRPAAWRSTDGLHWERSLDPTLGVGGGDIRFIIGVPSGFLAAGASEDGAGNLIAAQWTSGDGRTWKVVPTGEAGPAGDELDIGDWLATGSGAVLAVGSGAPATPASWWATP